MAAHKITLNPIITYISKIIDLKNQFKMDAFTLNVQEHVTEEIKHNSAAKTNALNNAPI